MLCQRMELQMSLHQRRNEPSSDRRKRTTKSLASLSRCVDSSCSIGRDSLRLRSEHRANSRLVSKRLRTVTEWLPHSNHRLRLMETLLKTVTAIRATISETNDSTVLH